MTTAMQPIVKETNRLEFLILFLTGVVTILSDIKQITKQCSHVSSSLKNGVNI